jgi:phage-related protein
MRARDWRSDIYTYILRPCSVARCSGSALLRIRSESAFRVFYAAKFEDGIVVIHAFQKKTQQTARLDLEIGAKRYRQFLAQRGRR